ncbi:MAG: hypothetical protein PVI30_12555 [Myxococcales bacterium]|jgi:hypothetical protein
MGSVKMLGLACLALLLAACSTSDRLADAGVDGGMPDGGSGGDGDGDGAGGEFGAGCESTAECADGLFCDEEIDLSFPADGLPPGVDDVPSSAFPGGLCTPFPASGYDPTGEDSCDPLAPVGAQGCGDDGVCIALTIGMQTLVACRPACDPAAPDAGCGRFGYTCNFDSGACVEGCQSDEECRLQLVDSDGDGVADTQAYDDETEAICSPDSFRCELPDPGPGETGDPCDRLDECEADGLCLDPLQPVVGHPFPDGFCTKRGCDVDGRECGGDGAVCTQLRPWSDSNSSIPLCMTECTVGAEDEADVVGSDGHGEGCRSGYRCHYNGGEDAEDGVCVGGNYNDIEESNVGAACEEDADCYSPYGLGGCLFLSVAGIQGPTGICSILDCAVPGIPQDVCGAGNPCIGLNRDITFCATTCKGADDCADGYACADDDGDPGTERICYPACFEDEECREGEECRLALDVPAGRCVES